MDAPFADRRSMVGNDKKYWFLLKRFNECGSKILSWSFSCSLCPYNSLYFPSIYVHCRSISKSIFFLFSFFLASFHRSFFVTGYEGTPHNVLDRQRREMKRLSRVRATIDTHYIQSIIKKKRKRERKS